MRIEDQLRLYVSATTVEEPDWVVTIEPDDLAIGGSGQRGDDTPSGRRFSRAAWILAAAVLVVVVGVVGVLAARSGGEQDPPAVTTFPPPTIPGVQPTALVPTQGEWAPFLLSTQGPSGQRQYQLSVSDTQGREWSLGVGPTVAALPSGDGFEVQQITGQAVTIDTAQSNKTSATWEPAPGTTATLLSPPGLGYGSDAVEAIESILNDLTVDADALHERFLQAAGTGLLILEPESTYLTNLAWVSTPSPTSLQASEILAAPGHEWGDISLVTHVGTDLGFVEGAQPVAVRGSIGSFAQPASGVNGPTQLQWVENGQVYMLGASTSISPDDLVALAELLRPAGRDLESLLFPDWQPAIGQSDSVPDEGPDVPDTAPPTAEETYCALMTNASGELGSVTAGGRQVLERRRQAAPQEIEEEWGTVLGGPATESDVSGRARKQDAYEAAITTIETFNQRHCTPQDPP